MSDEAGAKKSVSMSGVSAGRTAISSTHRDDKEVRYRGYDLRDLARGCDFEEVAYLLVHGTLPNQASLVSYRAWLRDMRVLPESTLRVLQDISADADPMDVLIAGVSSLGLVLPETSLDAESARRIGDRLIGSLPAMLLAWHAKTVQGNAAPHDGIARYVLNGLQGTPASDSHVRALNTAFILYAEHEFATSSFAARLVSSTGGTTYGAVVAGLAALKGAKHGGALQDAIAVQTRYKTPQEASAGIATRIERKERIAGFGHPVYRGADPRAAIIKDAARNLSDGAFFAVAETIENEMRTRKALHPNIDWYSAAAFHALGVPQPMFTCMFAMGRIAGWIAHIAEQREENTLLRPAAAYTGPAPRAFKTLQERD